MSPKGFSIDKALVSTGSAVEEKPGMERLETGTERTWRAGVAALMKGWESPIQLQTDRNGPARSRSQMGLHQEPSEHKSFVEPESSLVV